MATKAKTKEVKAEKADELQELLDDMVDEAAEGAEAGRDSIPVASLDDIRIVRFKKGPKKGEVVPLEVLTPMEATKVLISPLTFADRIRYKMEVDDDTKVTDFPFSLKYQIIRNHIVEPDFTDVSATELKNDFAWTTIDDLVSAVLTFSRDIFRRSLQKVQGEGVRIEPEEEEGKD